jgi:carbon storage regulator
MLVLARGVGQTVEMCDGLIEVTVLSIQGSIVRLGFNAPREINIVRQEVAQERLEAAVEPPLQSHCS